MNGHFVTFLLFTAAYVHSFVLRRPRTLVPLRLPFRLIDLSGSIHYPSPVTVSSSCDVLGVSTPPGEFYLRLSSFSSRLTTLNAGIPTFCSP